MDPSRCYFSSSFTENNRKTVDCVAHIDSLLREALVISGCSDTQTGNFDGHGTIELRFEQLPTLNIGRLDNDFWFWSRLPGLSDLQLAHDCEAIVKFLMKRYFFSRTEQIQLIKINGHLELRVLLADSVLIDAKTLASALNMYLVALEEFCNLLRQ